MNKIDRVILYVVALVSIAGLLLPTAGVISNLGGLTNYDEIGTTDGYEVDSTQVIDGSGNWVGSGTVTVGSGGTAITKYVCATATWNPGAMSSSTVASTSLLLAGSALGNVTLASFDAVSSTAEWIAEGKVTAVGSTTIFLRPQLGTQAYLAGLDLGTSTARTCIIQ